MLTTSIHTFGATPYQAITMSNQIPPAGESASRLRFYGDEFVFDVVSGMFFRLNPVASYMLRALDSGASPSELPHLLVERYRLDNATATRDAQLFINNLAAMEPLDRIFDTKAGRS
jgi:hypothetical protein